ncbi:unnamed protein product [Mycena citricolor]|uniref:Uncharacterized protein n=1 Tax=Mycena citricolor TaxID=2018698 RepID=A0AAD2HU32_9AGAR|nr:unnamed protein product [Mycena citricolor]
MSDPVAEPLPVEESVVEDSPGQAEHEASDLTLSDLTTNAPAEGAAGDEDTEDGHGADAESVATGVEDAAAAVTAKPVPAVKAAAKTSTNGTASGVKKILTSGTFGASKSVSSKPSTSSAPAKAPAAAPLKKSISGPTTTKPTMTASRPAPSGTAAAVRKLTVSATKLTGPSIKPSVSASKPTTASSGATARGSVTSPVGSSGANTKDAPARPRASVSEGVKRAPIAPRASLAAVTKPPSKLASSTASKPTATKAPPSASAAPAKTRTTASIASIKEVHEDTKALEELQTKLSEATDELAVKSQAAAELEAQVEDLKASLATALADIEAKGSSAPEVTEAQLASEMQLKSTTEALEKLRAEHEQSTSSLQAIQEELNAAREATTVQTQLVETLQLQIETLSAEVAKATESYAALQASQASVSSDASAAASIEHDALLKAQSDFGAIQVEIEALKDAHKQSLEDLEGKLSTAVEDKASAVATLEETLADLTSQKEEAIAKLSEFEVENLELKESQESAEDERTKTAEHISTLERELSEAVAATQAAIDKAAAEQTEHAAQAGATQASHEQAIKEIADAHAQTTTQLDALKAELDGARADHETAVSEHARLLAESEAASAKKEADLAEQIKVISADLESQESQYNAKVDVVKKEHEQLLQEAFERAKAEASSLHQQDLQSLRSESGSTMDQVRAIHESTIEQLKAEHASVIESTVGDLEKQLAKLNIELKATQDDLVKAKANLDGARAEILTMTAQRDEARTTLEATPELSPQHAEEITRLRHEVVAKSDDLQAVEEMLAITKASIQSISQNHTVELEEAAKARAEEATKLQAAHDEEVKAWNTQKSELTSRLSDLEGELATLKATMNAETAAPKSNGAVAVPQSPGITKEELQHLHEAHNLKMNDLQAQHEKELKALRDQLEKAAADLDESIASVARKAMEIQAGAMRHWFHTLLTLAAVSRVRSRRTDRPDHSVLQEDLEAAQLKIKTLESPAA